MKKSNREYMSNGAFAELAESAEQALAYERGEREGYRVTRVAVSGPHNLYPAGRTQALLEGIEP
jgi:hypothetical protein